MVPTLNHQFFRMIGKKSNSYKTSSYNTSMVIFIYLFSFEKLFLFLLLTFVSYLIKEKSNNVFLQFFIIYLYFYWFYLFLFSSRDLSENKICVSLLRQRIENCFYFQMYNNFTFEFCAIFLIHCFILNIIGEYFTTFDILCNRLGYEL